MCPTMGFPTLPFFRKRREGGDARLAGVEWDSYTHTEMSSEMLIKSRVRIFYTICFLSYKSLLQILAG